MKVAIHDYSGHPFQVQLSRELARRGHRVTHFWCPAYASGKGAVEETAADPQHFSIKPVSAARAISRTASWRRVGQEIAYGKAISRRVLDMAPDVVVSANNPLFAQQLLLGACRHASIPFVFWQQDIYSHGMTHGAQQKFGKRLGSVVGRCFSAMEANQLRKSDAVVAISEGFLPALRRWDVDSTQTHVIENWAPLDELPVRPRNNGWAAEHGLIGKRVAMYSGTLGLKHDPTLILSVARRLREDPLAQVVVISEGQGADWLVRRALDEGLSNLWVLPFQPYRLLPDVLGSADVHLTVLERDAGVYSVPSKILSYHCAARALVAALPAENLGADIIREAASGLVVDPSDADGFADAVSSLLRAPSRCEQFGANAREYAEEKFAIEGIASRFEVVLSRAVGAAAPLGHVSRTTTTNHVVQAREEGQ